MVILSRFQRKSKRESKRKQRAIQAADRRSRRAFVGRAVLGVVLVLALVVPVVFLSSPISYIPLIATLLLVAVSWVYLQVLRRSLTVSVANMSTSCERGQKSALGVSLLNKSGLPFSRIELEFFVTDLFGGYDDVRTVTCALGGKESLQISFDVTFSHLGSYAAGVSRVVVHDLLGLFSASLTEGARRAVVVRPRSVRMGDASLTRAIIDDSKSALRPISADDVDYSSVRDYNFGDPLKTVHWNLSARMPEGSLFTRLYEAHVNPTLSIIVDPYAPEWGEEDLMSLFDGIVEVTATLAAQARASGVEADIRFLDRAGEPAQARLAAMKDADELIRDMLRITPVAEGDARSFAVEEMLRSCGMQSHGSGNVALVTSRPDAGLVATLVEITGRQRNAMEFLAVPRGLEGKDRDRFTAPLNRLGAVGAPYYFVESNQLSTEVMGL